jgi:hypothetical protein
VESKLVPYGQKTAGGSPTGLQVGITSWVGKKLYHGYRAGYFDAKSFDPDYVRTHDVGKAGTGEGTNGFWATPSFALAKTFGMKGGVVECYLDVKRAVTFNEDAVSWVPKRELVEALEAIGISMASLRDSAGLTDRLMYYRLSGLDPNGKPWADPMRGKGTTQFYGFIDDCWDLFRRHGFDGVCLPERGVPTVAALDFSQVTFGKRVKTGDDVRDWNQYDVAPFGGQGGSSPAPSGPVQLKPPKPATTEPPKQAPVPKPVSVPKPAKVQKVSLKPAPKVSPQDGPDPRFKEGELFASKRSFVGFPVSPLFSGGARGSILHSSVVGDFPSTGHPALDRLSKKVNAVLRGVSDRLVQSFSLIRRVVGEGAVILQYQASASVSCTVSIGLKSGEIRLRVDVAGQVRFAGPFVDMDLDRIRVALEVIFGGVK